MVATSCSRAVSMVTCTTLGVHQPDLKLYLYKPRSKKSQPPIRRPPNTWRSLPLGFPTLSVSCWWMEVRWLWFF
ncbi:hypothetical protein L3X38_041637 [Prunus dulcis]|uniref:Uncharacterized protein n=1 Tax=Prunus dulcis TaxID=3755 RepID=A0AAD4UTE8_PRUDU|nr:hypothetical protein L3X38_041637 [Prunus dulcis]